ncbi:acylneuraminate cytidylyltransferase family protein [Amylibacter sp.]|nr:acylneuraminate cytidylyltransferase family protein [Amylibacter sp.]
MKKVTCFLPCRKGSERVPQKNIKKFANHELGLIDIKLTQLQGVSSIEKILVSSDDPEVLERASVKRYTKVILDSRPRHLALSSTSTDELISYVPSITQSPHILWTHVTSPFIDSAVYEDAIFKYFEALDSDEYDSLMSVTKHQNFFWDKNGPYNYDPLSEKWPRTQTIEPIYEINSGFFIGQRRSYVEINDRIGKKPLLFPVDGTCALDIDWPEDFKLAEEIWRIRRG